MRLMKLVRLPAATSTRPAASTATDTRNSTATPRPVAKTLLALQQRGARQNYNLVTGFESFDNFGVLPVARADDDVPRVENTHLVVYEDDGIFAAAGDPKRVAIRRRIRVAELGHHAGSFLRRSILETGAHIA
jgi:hypothetical protein